MVFVRVGRVVRVWPTVASLETVWSVGKNISIQPAWTPAL
jgi:hypothetical protein